MDLDATTQDRRARTARPARRLLAVVVLAAVGVGACSGDGAAEATDDTDRDATTTVAPGAASSSTTATAPDEGLTDTTGGGTTEPITITSSPPGSDDSDDGSIEPSGEPAEVVLVLELDGVGSIDPASAAIRHLPFGAPFDEVAAAIEPIIGTPEQDVAQDDCPPGPARVLSYAGGLDLVVMDGELVGWSLGADADPSLTTVGGIGVGSTLEQVRGVLTDVVVQDSSLGVELRAGVQDEDVDGLLSGVLDGPGDAAALTTLWAGTTCVAR